MTLDSQISEPIVFAADISKRLPLEQPMMAFMKPQIDYGDWWEVDGPSGTEWIPAEFANVPQEALDAISQATGPSPIPDAIRDYCENSECWTVQKITGYGARFSAPGYLDSTEWVVFGTREEAEDYLREQMAEDEAEEEES
jgi:hypothetical protein